MRVFRSKILAFLMLITAVTFSTGMGFVEHTCKMKNETTVSLTKKKSCCAARKDCRHEGKTTRTQVKKAACCADETLYIHVDFAGFEQKITHFFGDVFTTIAQGFYNFFRSFTDTRENALHYTNSSPPLAGREILTKNCTYQI